ncbi:PREDICTED: beta-defensin 110 [Dipodomys ordii]|uniref:Beta-defensin n=1 Tax=Dipodomys ordii TaxID=10020 RepID=A0A1S3FEZ7_DIPOR|nr:PREDICTED: beta-defensin 110 [Dipodomys ordii]XP_042527785.1 beta-defensin 110-like [Dipodomys spectabilis]
MEVHLFLFILVFWSTILSAVSSHPPKYRLERCNKVKGTCKPFCDDVEYDYGYCILWRNQCCV